MDWNNGTIFRVYILTSIAEIINSTFTTTVNIDQQILNGKVFMGVENFILEPVVNTNPTRDYWATLPLIQLSSINLPPYIDYSSYPAFFKKSENTKIFARIPLILTPTLGNSATPAVNEVRFGFNQLLNKDSIIYEMLNNQNALSNGKLTIRVLDVGGDPIPDGYINNIYFTLVIYKPNDRYSN
jgi:hypothetical protein